MKIITILFVVIRLLLGGMMIYGGYQKFSKPIPATTQMLEQIEKEGSQKLKENIQTLKIKNFIFGMKQTNYFWQFLGICELTLGILLISQYLSFVAAIMLVPITLNIFLFHVFLEPDDIVELLETGLMLIGNLALIAKDYPKWKHLIINDLR